MGKERPDEVSSATNIGPTKRIDTGGEEEKPKTGQSFESFMKEGEASKTPGEPGEITPFDLAKQGLPQAATPTHETIISQMNSASSVLGDLQKQLQTKNLKLKQSQKYLLRNKLSSANQNIRSAAVKAGVDVGPAPSMTSRQNPIAKFLALISDGQSQLSQTKSLIHKLNVTGSQLDPGKLLLIQIKLAKAQQEMEYSSVLLSTAVSDIKTMFNIQI